MYIKTKMTYTVQRRGILRLYGYGIINEMFRSSISGLFLFQEGVLT